MRESLVLETAVWLQYLSGKPLWKEEKMVDDVAVTLGFSFILYWSFANYLMRMRNNNSNQQ